MALEVAFHSNDFSNNANRYIQVRAGDSVGILLPNATGTETNGVPSNGILDNRTPPASRLRHTDLVQFQTSLIPSVPSNFLPIVFLSCPIYAQSGHTIILPPAIYITRNINNSIVSRNRPVIGGPGRIIIGLNYARSSQYNANQYYPSTHNIPELSGSLIENDGIPVVGYNGGTVVVINNVVDSSRNSMNPPSRPSFGTYTGSALGYSPGILNRMIIRGAKILFANCSGNHGDRYGSGQPSSPFDSNPIDAKDVVFQTLPSYTVGTSTVSEGRIRHMSTSSVFERVTYFNAGILMGQQPYTYSAISLLGQTANIYFQHGGAFSPLIYSIEGDLETRDPSTQGFGLSLHRNNTSETISNVQRRSVGHVVFHRNTSATVGDEIYHPYVFYRSDHEAMTSSQRANFIRLGTVVQENKYNLRLSTTNNNFLNSSASMSAIALPTANTSRGLSPIRYKVKASSNLRFTTSVNSDRDLLRIKSVQYNVGALQNDDLVRTFDWRSAFGEYGSISEVPALNINAIANRYVKVEADPAGATTNFVPYDSPVYRIDGSTPITPASSTQSARRSELNLNALEGSTLSGNLDQIRLNGMILTLLKEDMHTDNTRTLTITVSSGNLNLALPSGTNWNTEMRVQSATQLLDRYFAIEAYTMGSAVAINAVNTGVGFEVVSVNNHNLVLRGKAGVTHVAQNALTRVRVYIPLSVDATATLNFKIEGVSTTEFSVEAVGADAATFNWLHYFGYTNSYYLEDKVFAMELTQGRTGATVPLHDANQVEGIDFLRLESPTKIFFSNRLNQGFRAFSQDNVDNMTIRITNSASDTETYPMASRWRMDGTSSSRLGLARVNDGGDDDLWGLRLPVEIKETFSRHFIPGTRFRLRVGQAHAQTVAHQKNEIDDIFEIERTTSAITGVGDARAAEMTFFFRALMGKDVNPTPSSSITRGLTDWTVEFYLDSASHPFALRKRVSFDSDQTNQLFETQIIKSVNETSVYQGFQNIIIDGGGTTTQEIRESRMERNYRSPCNSVTVNFAPSTRTVTLTFSFLVLHGVYDNDLRALYKVAGTKGQRRPGLSHHNQETKILIGGIDPSLTAVRALNGVHDITAVTRNTISFVLPSGQTVTDGTNILTNTTANTLSAGFGHANVWDERTWDVTVHAQGYDDINYSLSPAQLDGELTQNFLMSRNFDTSANNIGDPNVISTLPSMLRAIEALETRIGIKLVEVVQDGGGDPNSDSSSLTVSTAGVLDSISGARFTYDIEFRKEAHRTTGTQRAGAELVDNRIVIYSNIGQADDASQDAIPNPRDRLREQDRLESADQNIFGLKARSDLEQTTVLRLICGQLTTPDETANSGANSLRIPSTGAINPAFIGDNPTKFLNFALHETRAGSDGKYITPIRVSAPNIRARADTTSPIKLTARYYESDEGDYGTPAFSLPSNITAGSSVRNKFYHSRVSSNTGSNLRVAMYFPDTYLLKNTKSVYVQAHRYAPHGINGGIFIEGLVIQSTGLMYSVAFTEDDFFDARNATIGGGPTSNATINTDSLGLENQTLAGITRLITSNGFNGATTLSHLNYYRYSVTTSGTGSLRRYTLTLDINPSHNVGLFVNTSGVIEPTATTFRAWVGGGKNLNVIQEGIKLTSSGEFYRETLSVPRELNTGSSAITIRIIDTTNFRFTMILSAPNAPNVPSVSNVLSRGRIQFLLPILRFKDVAQTVDFPGGIRTGGWLVSKLARIQYNKIRSPLIDDCFTNITDVITGVSSSATQTSGVISMARNVQIFGPTTGSLNIEFGVSLLVTADQLPSSIRTRSTFSVGTGNTLGFVVSVFLEVSGFDFVRVTHTTVSQTSSQRTRTTEITNAYRGFVPRERTIRILFLSNQTTPGEFQRILVARDGKQPLLYEIPINTSQLISPRYVDDNIDNTSASIPSNVTVAINNDTFSSGSSTFRSDGRSLSILFTVSGTVPNTPGTAELTERQFNELIIRQVYRTEEYANIAISRKEGRLIRFASGEVEANDAVDFIMNAPTGVNPGSLRVHTHVPSVNAPSRIFGAGAMAVTATIMFDTSTSIAGSGVIEAMYNRLSPDMNDLRNRVRNVQGSLPEGHGTPRLTSDEPFVFGSGVNEIPRSSFTSTSRFTVPAGYGSPSDLTVSLGDLMFLIDNEITSSTLSGFETNQDLRGNINFHPESGDSIHLNMYFSLNTTANTPISTAIEAIIIQAELITEVQSKRSVAKVIPIGEHATRTTTNLIDTNIQIGSENSILGNVYSFRILITQIIPRGFVQSAAGREALQDVDRMGRVLANDYQFGTGTSLSIGFRTLEIRRLSQPDLFEQTSRSVMATDANVCDIRSEMTQVTKTDNKTQVFNPTFDLTNFLVSSGSGAALTLRTVSTIPNLVMTIGDLTTTAIVLSANLGASYPVIESDRIRLRMKAEGSLSVDNISFSILLTLRTTRINYDLPLHYVTLTRQAMSSESYTDIYFNLGCILNDIGLREYTHLNFTIDFTNAPDQPDATDQIILVFNSLSLQRATVPDVNIIDKVNTMLTPQMADATMYAISTNAAENISGGGGGGSLSSNQGTALDRLYAMTTGTGSSAVFVGRAFDSLITSAARRNFSDVITKLDELDATDISELIDIIGWAHDEGSNLWTKMADMGDAWDGMTEQRTENSVRYQRFSASALETIWGVGQDTTLRNNSTQVLGAAARLISMTTLQTSSTTNYALTTNAFQNLTVTGGGGTTLTSDQTGALDSLHAMISSNQFKDTALSNALTTAQKTVFTNLTGMIMGSGNSASFKPTAIPAISVGRVQLSTTNETLLARLNSMTTGTGGASTFMQQAFNNLPSVAVSGTVSLDSALETIITNMEGLISGTGTSSVIRSGAFANLPAVSVTGTVSLDSSLETIITNLGGMQSGMGDSTSFKPTAIPAVDIDGLTNAADLTNLVTSLTAMITNNVFNDTAFRELYRLMFLLSGVFHVVTGSNTGTQTIKLFKDQSDYDLYISTSGATDRSSITQTVTRSLASGLLSGQNSDVTKALLSTWGLGDITS